MRLAQASPAVMPDEPGRQPLAVFDFGKTSSKMFVFAPDLTILDQERCAPIWVEERLGEGSCRVLDSEHLWRWMKAALAHAVQRWAIGGVMVSTHGCAAALVGGGELQWPILDYESEPPAAVNAAYAAVAPDFTESHTPHLAGGLNLARQIFWVEANRPDVLARSQAILLYPQYWNWKLGGRAVTEISSLGCHSHLWSPRGDDFSSLVDARGWRDRFPPFERAGSVLGACAVAPQGGGDAVPLRVHNGVHDSNASLYFYRSLGHVDSTVVSTGTWVIVFNPDCPLEALDAQRDMLANMTIDRRPIATARFMGGREYDLLTLGVHHDVDAAAIAAAIRRGQFALPSFAPGGPYPSVPGRIVGPMPATGTERAAIGALYLACMTDAVLSLIRSDKAVIIDGGLAYNAAFLGLLAALRRPQPLLVNPKAEGSASGAAAIAYESLGHRPRLEACTAVDAWAVPGLAEYHARWRELAAANAPDQTIAA